MAFVVALALVVLPASGLAAGDSGEPVYIEAAALPAAQLEYDYRDYAEIKDIILGAASAYPDICAVHDIGDSWEKTEGLADRDILAVKISDNVDSEEDEPEMLIMALHHAREWPTSEVATELVLALTSSYGTDARISWLVDNREIWIVPVVNPDGLDYALYSDDDWRKNRRDNLDGTYGVDPNRNYDGSQDGNPLGEWGGAGSSTITSSPVYCGEAPFSEPETQAIRDLALSHDFQIAFDFHTHGDLLCWPWGYTTDLAPDNDILVELGTMIAAVNGYTAEQSSTMYLTTGDSLDWLYGGLGVFAFLFEMGDEFHPKWHEEVTGIITENIPASLLGIELAGDRYLKEFTIVHEPEEDVTSDEGDVTFVASVIAERGVDSSSVSLEYRIDSGDWDSAAMTAGDGDSYDCVVPSVSSGSTIEYYISAVDLGGVTLTEPRYAPYATHTYSLGASSDPPVAEAGEDQEVLVGSSVTLSGAGSTDDVGIESYVWTVDAEGYAPLEGVDVEIQFDDIGDYTVTLTVTDGDGQSDTDVVEVTVYDDVPPVADAGDDQEAAIGELVALTGVGSTDNDEIDNYTWEFSYDGGSKEVYGEVAYFTFEIAGEYVVTLTVTDKAGNTDTDSTVVTVSSEVIPEFSTLILPVVAMLALFLLIRARRF